VERAAIDGEVAGIRVAGAQANGWLLLPSSLCARLIVHLVCCWFWPLKTCLISSCALMAVVQLWLSAKIGRI